MASETFGDGTPFTITQIEENGTESGFISLIGRALPYRPVSFSGTQRIETTWYPGNPVASIQVFGATEGETTINGFWKDRFLDDNGDSSSAIVRVSPDGSSATRLTTAEAVAVAMQRVRREGKLVKVEWDIVARIGIITKADFTFHNTHDIEWSVTFQWISVGMSTFSPPLINASGVNDFLNTLSSLSAKMTQYVDKARGYAQPFIDKVNNGLKAVNSAIDQFSGIVQQAENAVLDPVQQAQQTTAAINNIDNKFADLIDSVQATPDVVQAQAAGAIPNVGLAGAAGGQPSYGSALAVESFSRNIGSSASEGRQLSANQRLKIAQQADPNVLAAFTARQDTDLRDVSTRYYGTPDNWIAIKTYNHLVGSRLNAGQSVLVPSLQVKAGR